MRKEKSRQTLVPVIAGVQSQALKSSAGCVPINTFLAVVQQGQSASCPPPAPDPPLVVPGAESDRLEAVRVTRGLHRLGVVVPGVQSATRQRSQVTAQRRGPPPAADLAPSFSGLSALRIFSLRGHHPLWKPGPAQLAPGTVQRPPCEPE